MCSPVVQVGRLLQNALRYGFEFAKVPQVDTAIRQFMKKAAKLIFVDGGLDGPAKNNPASFGSGEQALEFLRIFASKGEPRLRTGYVVIGLGLC